jgi:hypothetical protein
MTTNSKPGHGEGDPESAKRFNEAETRFVDSARGKQKVRDGAKVRPEHEASWRKPNASARHARGAPRSRCRSSVGVSGELTAMPAVNVRRRTDQVSTSV